MLKTTDHLDIVRLRRTYAGNYDISNDDIVNRLEEWSPLCRFEVVGAASNWVALVFETLPEKLCAFAEDVYLFCPDAVEQGTGLVREEREPQRFDAARRLCPTLSSRIARRQASMLKEAGISPAELGALRDPIAAMGGWTTSTEMGVRLLAEQILRTKYLWLWWD